MGGEGGINATSRQKFRFVGGSPSAAQIATVECPGSTAALYLKELEGNAPVPVVRFDLIADAAGARVRLASAFVDGRLTRGQSALLAAVAGFPATAWHIEASSASSRLQVGVSLVVGACGCGSGKPSIYVPDRFAEPSTDTPPALLVGRANPQRYRYLPGVADAVVPIPVGAHLHTVSGIAGGAPGTIEIDNGLGGPITVPAGTPFSESWDTDDASSQARGPTNVRFTGLASWFVSWFEGD